MNPRQHLPSSRRSTADHDAGMRHFCRSPAQAGEPLCQCATALMAGGMPVYPRFNVPFPAF